jgi:hypothetical protein
MPVAGPGPGLEQRVSGGRDATGGTIEAFVTDLGPERAAVAADPALVWSSKLGVQIGGATTVAHAVVVLPRRLADRLG